MTRLKALLITICFATCCYGQNDSLTIGPADLLHIKVLEAPELEQNTRVTDSGTVPLILGGNVKVVGMTPSEAAEAIQKVLVEGHYLLSPHVTVTLDQPGTQNVTVMGQVRLPGSYPIGTPRSAMDVLALAGGPTDLASRKITIERRNTKETIEFFLSNKSDVALKANVVVFPGDIVLVPKADVVYILGNVTRPGGFTMATNDGKLSILQAVALAGGTPPTAVPSKTRLIRKQADGTYIEVNVQLSAMQKGRQSDLPLQADDIVYIPFSYLKNMAMGIDSLLSAATAASIYHF